MHETQPKQEILFIIKPSSTYAYYRRDPSLHENNPLTYELRDDKYFGEHVLEQNSCVQLSNTNHPLPDITLAGIIARFLEA